MAARAALTNERGIALLTVLAVLAMLLIVGSLVAGAARVESMFSGVSRQSERAFAAADAGLGLALGDADNFIQNGQRCTPDLAAAGLPVTGSVCVTFQSCGLPPVELHLGATDNTGAGIKGWYFDVKGTGTAANSASSSLDLTAFRVAPRGACL